MKQRLEMLEQLQDIDLLIDTLKGSQARLQEEIDAIAQSREDARSAHTEILNRIAAAEQEKTELEASHAAELENIRRSETNMKEIKTNKEYQAVGREISAARKLSTELETQILQKISQLEELAAEGEQKQSQLSDLEDNSSQRIAEKQSEIDNLQQDIDADATRRDVVTKELPASLVKRYTSLRGQRKGLAVAIARDGYCLGCNMNLPPQLYNSLFRGEEIQACPHCQRVLVLKQAPVE